MFPLKLKKYFSVIEVLMDAFVSCGEGPHDAVSCPCTSLASPHKDDRGMPMVCCLFCCSWTRKWYDNDTIPCDDVVNDQWDNVVIACLEMPSLFRFRRGGYAGSQQFEVIFYFYKMVTVIKTLNKNTQSQVIVM